ncbi:hypothetical protein GCM10007391_07720 [Alteromonas halophila]|uniref:Uncharacterized protein n=1 Tax=Alteromonas halophila TaxID=516698 RepID=A0A918JGE2_9ALTE|nr:hypothetical protein GCM10007391_07720 [Alteromonas halophila]
MRLSYRNVPDTDYIIGLEVPAFEGTTVWLSGARKTVLPDVAGRHTFSGNGAENY